MQAVKWVVAKLQGDKTASFCGKISGLEVTGRYIGIPVFHGTLLPMDFWTPPRFLTISCQDIHFSNIFSGHVLSFYRILVKLQWSEIQTSDNNLSGRVTHFTILNISRKRFIRPENIFWCGWQSIMSFPQIFCGLSEWCLFWVHANGGIINGGVACVCAKWRVFEQICAFLRFLVPFFMPKSPVEKHNFAQSCAKMRKKRFYAIPPFSYTPFCVSPTIVVQEVCLRASCSLLACLLARSLAAVASLHRSLLHHGERWRLICSINTVSRSSQTKSTMIARFGHVHRGTARGGPGAREK